MMEWEGEWIPESVLEGPYPAGQWPRWLHPYQQAYALYRNRRTNGGIIRCLTCDYCLQLPIYPTDGDQRRGRVWLADHWLSHAEDGGGLLILDGEDSSLAQE